MSLQELLLAVSTASVAITSADLVPGLLCSSCGPKAFGLATLSATQTPRLLLFNDGSATCLVRVDFLTDDGAVFGSATRAVSSHQGVKMDGSVFQGDSAPWPVRLRPVITPVSAQPLLCSSLRATYEIADKKTGWTDLVVPQRDNFPPDQAARVPVYGFVTTAPAEVEFIRLSVVNAGASACQLTAGFSDGGVEALTSQNVKLEAGKSLIVDQPGTGGQVRPFLQSGNCPDLVQTVEVIDAAAKKAKIAIQDIKVSKRLDKSSP